MLVSNPMFEREFELLPMIERIERNSYLEYVAKVINDYRQSMKVPTIISMAVVRVRRAARSARSAVRQTFAARKAAKSADGGGGDPDGRPRPQQSYTLKNPRNTSFPAAFLLGGAL
jgi:hypothetical protein